MTSNGRPANQTTRTKRTTDIHTTIRTVMSIGTVIRIAEIMATATGMLIPTNTAMHTAMVTRIHIHMGHLTPTLIRSNTPAHRVLLREVQTRTMQLKRSSMLAGIPTFRFLVGRLRFGVRLRTTQRKRRHSPEMYHTATSLRAPSRATPSPLIQPNNRCSRDPILIGLQPGARS